jgi:DNA-binding helix-hairpin-helix protein with protein kinase domain
MDLRPDKYASLPDLFKRKPKVKGATTRSLTIVCINTVEAFREVHANGMAYRDINWGNLFFEPVTGDVLICDNDNAIFENLPSQIGGTMEFMAPELVRGDPGAKPWTQTDLHSLAVLLFMVLLNHHPLQGARELQIHCFDVPAKKRLYGEAPLFIFDPDDSSNGPIPGEHDHIEAVWKLLPARVRELFVRSFTLGLRNTEDGRVRESEWLGALSRMCDTIVNCANCGKQNWFDLDTYRVTGDTGACFHCGQALSLDPPIGDLVARQVK